MARSNSAGSFTSRIACLCWLTSPGQSLPLNWGSKYCFSTTRQVLANIFSRSSRESCIVSTFVKWNLASPLADDLKRGPVVRSGLITVFLKNIEFCAIQSGSVIHALGKMAVEPFHERGREAVIGWPQRPSLRPSGTLPPDCQPPLRPRSCRSPCHRRRGSPVPPSAKAREFLLPATGRRPWIVAHRPGAVLIGPAPAGSPPHAPQNAELRNRRAVPISNSLPWLAGRPKRRCLGRWCGPLLEFLRRRRVADRCSGC